MLFQSIALLILFFMNLGLGKTLPWGYLPDPMGRTIWICISVFFLMTIFSPILQKKICEFWDRLTISKKWLRLLLIGDVAYILLTWIHFRNMGYEFPWLHLCIATIGWFAVENARFGVSAVISLGFFSASIFHFPLDYHRSDMLPAIASTLDMWSKGQGIYSEVNLGDWKALAHYLPGTLFSHLPAWFAGIDLRFNQLLYRSLWILLILWKLKRDPKIGVKSSHQRILHFLLLNPYFLARHELYFDFYLLLLVAFWVIPKYRLLVLALAAWTRQWVWVLIPFIVLDEMKEQRSVRPAFFFLFYLIAVTGVFSLLFVDLADLERFSSASRLLNSFQDAPTYIGDYGLTFAPALFWTGIAGKTQWIQAGVCIVIFFLAALSIKFSRIRKCLPVQNFYELGLITLSLVLITNALFWNYFWVSISVWVVTGVVLNSKELSDPLRN